MPVLSSVLFVQAVFMGMYKQAADLDAVCDLQVFVL